MKKRTIETPKIIILILLVMIAGLLLHNQQNHKTNQSTVIANNQEITTEEYNNQKEIQNLKNNYNNDDIIGIIKIENTNIEEPILKYVDNDYYLTHDNYGNANSLGSIYMDYRTNMEDRKILIYGHSSTKKDVPFNELENYYNKEYYQNHKEITLIGEFDTYEYEIFSIYVETKDFTYMNLKIDDNKYNNDLISASDSA